MKKNYKVKLSGNKLRIKQGNSCLSIDLDTFSVLKIEQKDNKLCFVEESEIISSVEFSSVGEAEEACGMISNKIFKKNKKFIASIFFTKFLVIVLLVALFINLLIISVDRYRQISYIKQQQEIALRNQELQAEQYEVQSNIDSASGQGVPVSDIFSIYE